MYGSTMTFEPGAKSIEHQTSGTLTDTCLSMIFASLNFLEVAGFDIQKLANCSSVRSPHPHLPDEALCRLYIIQVFFVARRLKNQATVIFFEPFEHALLACPWAICVSPDDNIHKCPLHRVFEGLLGKLGLRRVILATHCLDRYGTSTRSLTLRRRSCILGSSRRLRS